MKQHSMDSATLDAWAKSFNLPTVLGTDVVDRLRNSLHKLGHNHIEVVSILNDATGTLVSIAFFFSFFFLLITKTYLHKQSQHFHLSISVIKIN